MKTTLEMFKEIEDLDMPDGVDITVKDIVPFMCEKVEQALQRLEAIDNSNPSEALKLVEELDNCLISDMSIEVDDYDESNYCMSYEYVDFNGEGLQFNDDIKEETIIDFIREKKISTIKQALLKQQEHNYLKWEDLEFGKTPHKLKCKMNDSLYRIEWFVDGMGFKTVYIYLYVTKDYLEFCTYLQDDKKQFFNDLHLERVEE